jgi:hypothetical protein
MLDVQADSRTGAQRMSNETHSERVRWIAVATTGEDDDWCIRREGESTGASVAQMLWKWDAEEIVKAHNDSIAMPAETHSEKGLRELVATLLSKGRFFHGYTYQGDGDEMHYALFETDPGKLDEAEENNEILRFEIPPLTRKEHEALEQALAATPAVREPGPTRYNLTVRPWAASGGSTVHDEMVSYEAKDAREAIMALYAAGDYEWTLWRLIDVRPSSAGEAAPATFEEGRLAGREEIMQIVDADSADHIRRVLAKWAATEKGEADGKQG